MAAIDNLFSTLQLRVLTAQRARLQSSWEVPEHALPCNKIYCVLAGAGGYELDGRSFQLGTDGLCLQPVKHRVRCWHDPKNPFDKIWIHFDARILGLVDFFDVIPCPDPITLEATHPIRILLEQMVEEENRAGGFKSLAQNGRLLLALAQILRKCAITGQRADAVLRGPGDRIGKVLAHVAEHYAEALTLESLAAVVELHPTYFSNNFRKLTGFRPMAFLQGFRIERAKSLLASTDLPVMEVAARVGFADPYHFSRVFKKFAGCPPTFFQNSMRRASPH